MKILSNILVKAGVIVEQQIAIGTNSPFAGYNIDSRGSHNFGNTSSEVYHYFQSSNVSGGSTLSVYTNNTSANSSRSHIMLADTAASVPTRFGLGVFTGETPYAYLDSASKLVINNASGANVIIGGVTDTGHKLNVIGTTRLGGNVTLADNANLITTNQFYAGSSNYANSIFVGWDVSAVYLGYGFGSLPIHIGTNGSGQIAFRNTGGFRIESFSGTGSRMVVADSSGVLSTQAIPSLSNYVTLDTVQTITESKTFASTALFNNGILLKDGATSVAAGHFGIASLNSTTLGFQSSSGRGFDLIVPISGQAYTLPNATGTIALTSDIPSLTNYVTTNTTQTISGQKTFSALTTIFDSTQTATFIEGRASGVLYGGMSFSLFMQFNAYAAATGGYLWKNGAGDNVMALSQAGALTVNNLAGSGVRMVVADANGVITTQAIPSGGTSASTRTIEKFTSTANQTTFTITGGYTVGMVDVFLNGVKIDNATDFTATNGTTVVLTEALASGQTVEVYKYGSQFIINNGLRQTTLFSATAGQTTFTVSYSVGLVDVFYNGSKLDSSEYTATNGTSIVLGTACAVNDKVEVIAYSYNVSGFTGVGGSGTTNYIPKWTASGTLGNSLIWDDGTKVGINTASPSYVLDVQANNSTFVNRIINLNTTTDSAGLLIQAGVNSANEIALFRNAAGTTRMAIYANGYVGIGSTNPGAILTIATPSGVSETLRLICADTIGDGYISWYRTTGIRKSFLGYGGSNDDNFYIAQEENAPTIFMTNGTERMRISADGSMGFNNTTLGSRSFTFQALSNRPIVIEAVENAGVHSTIIRPNNSGYNLISSNYLSGGTYLPLSLSARENTSDFIIRNNGNVLIGTTSDVGQKLRIYQPTSGNWNVKMIQPNGSNQLFTEFLTTTDGDASNTARGSITYNGTNVLFNGSSDYRLKEDLKDYNGLSIISQLKTYDFKWKEAGTRDYGMMAHELQEVLPNYVTGEKDGLNADGSIKVQGVDYSKIVPVLIKGLQEEDAKVNAQELRIQQLEQEVITLKSQLGSN